MNPIGNFGETVAADIASKAVDDGQSEQAVDLGSEPAVTSPTSSPTGGPTGGPTHRPTISPTRGPTSVPTSGPTSSPTSGPTSGPTSSPTSKPTQSGTVTIDTEVEAAVLAEVEDDTERGGKPWGNTMIITNVDEGDMIFNDKSGVSVDKNGDTEKNDVVSTGADDAEDADGLGYEIIYPDHDSGSMRRISIGYVSTILSGTIFLKCLIELL